MGLEKYFFGMQAILKMITVMQMGIPNKIILFYEGSNDIFEDWLRHEGWTSTILLCPKENFDQTSPVSGLSTSIEYLILTRTRFIVTTIMSLLSPYHYDKNPSCL